MRHLPFYPILPLFRIFSSYFTPDSLLPVRYSFSTISRTFHYYRSSTSFLFSYLKHLSLLKARPLVVFVPESYCLDTLLALSSCTFLKLVSYKTDSDYQPCLDDIHLSIQTCQPDCFIYCHYFKITPPSPDLVKLTSSFCFLEDMAHVDPHSFLSYNSLFVRFSSIHKHLALPSLCLARVPDHDPFSSTHKLSPTFSFQLYSDSTWLCKRLLQSIFKTIQPQPHTSQPIKTRSYTAQNPSFLSLLLFRFYCYVNLFIHSTYSTTVESDISQLIPFTKTQPTSSYSYLQPLIAVGPLDRLLHSCTRQPSFIYWPTFTTYALSHQLKVIPKKGHIFLPANRSLSPVTTQTHYIRAFSTSTLATVSSASIEEYLYTISNSDVCLLQTPPFLNLLKTRLNLRIHYKLLKYDQTIVGAIAIHTLRFPFVTLSILNGGITPIPSHHNLRLHQLYLLFYQKIQKDSSSLFTINILRNTYLSPREFGPHLLSFIGSPLSFLPSYGTSTIDLLQSENDIFRSLSSKWRNCLRKAQKSNLTVTSTPMNADNLSIFYSNYSLFAASKSFQPLPFNLFCAHLNDTRVVTPYIYSAFLDDPNQPIASVIVLHAPCTSTYVASYVDSQFYKLNPIYLLLWTAICHSQALQRHTFDLGGLDSSTPSGIAHFKRGLNGSTKSTQVPRCKIQLTP